MKFVYQQTFLGIVGAIMGAAIVMSGCGGVERGAADGRLNLIIISLDTLRADHLGAYQYPRNTSPNIDRFARESTVFTHSFANSNWTLPSHMSLMTSLYPGEHDVVNKTNRLSPRITTLAQVMKREGYLTAAFTAGYFVDKKFGFDRGFDVYHQSYDFERRNTGQGWRLEHLEKDLFSWLDSHGKEEFFLFIHSYDVHEPFIAHRYIEEFNPVYDGWATHLDNMDRFKASPEYKEYVEREEPRYFNINLFYRKVINEGLVDLTDADREHLVALYDNEVRYADEYFGRIRKKLEDLGLWENTVVVLLSDHGEELFERGGIRHGGRLLHDEVLRVPLVIRIPGAVPRVTPELVQGIDVAPTVLDVLGIAPESSFAGKALLGGGAANAYVIAQGKDCECIRTDTWKLSFRRDGRLIELFDLEKDPGESFNQVMDLPDKVTELTPMLNEALNRMVTDEEMRRQLEALGYLD